MTGIKTAAMPKMAISVTASFFRPPSLSTSLRKGVYIATAIIAPQAMSEMNGVRICKHQANIRNITPSRIAISIARVVGVFCDSPDEFISVCSSGCISREQAYTSSVSDLIRSAGLVMIDQAMLVPGRSIMGQMVFVSGGLFVHIEQLGGFGIWLEHIRQCETSQCFKVGL